MRIGILTFHAAHNYGAVLQCYALQTYIRSIGHDVSVINYRNERMLAGYKVFNKKRFVRKNPFLFLEQLLIELQYYRLRKNRAIGFNNFIENNLKLEAVSTIEDNPYDLIIVGSDQVWNTKLTYGYDSYYWGEFARPSNTKLASYAASMQDSWPQSEDSIISNKLKHFDYLSVRESSLQEELLKKLGKNVSHVVDPTLLLTGEQWSKVAKKPMIEKPYLFLYQVDCKKQNEEIARRIACEKGLELVCLSAEATDTNSKSVIASSPSEFVGLFLYADFVICSSFHGTVFSLLFRKPFLSIKSGKGKNARVASLLSSLGLEDHFVEVEDVVSSDGDYRLDEERFNQIVNTSKYYIDTITSYE